MGKGIYKSTYIKKKPYYNSFWEADSRTCTCRCNSSKSLSATSATGMPPASSFTLSTNQLLQQ